MEVKTHFQVKAQRYAALHKYQLSPQTNRDQPQLPYTIYSFIVLYPHTIVFVSQNPEKKEMLIIFSRNCGYKS
jgi:hypothetical protein